jgi:hypothetical protein
MTDDERALRALAAGGLEAISWREGTAPDWNAFFGPYVAGAVLCPSARPAATVTPDAFRARMDAQRESRALRSLEEAPLGTTVQVFGNVAVVLSAFEARVNGGDPGRGVNAYLCVKDGGAWKIVAVAWDNERADATLPATLARAAD